MGEVLKRPLLQLDIRVQQEQIAPFGNPGAPVNAPGKAEVGRIDQQGYLVCIRFYMLPGGINGSIVNNNDFTLDITRVNYGIQTGRYVRLGKHSPEKQVEVISGLKAGDKIVINK